MLEYNIQEMNERTFSFIYGCALHDAILQKAFNGKKDWIEKVTSAQEPVKEYINAVLSSKCNDKNIHEEVCEKVITCGKSHGFIPKQLTVAPENNEKNTEFLILFEKN